MHDTNTLSAQLQAWAERSPDAVALRHKVLDVWVARSWREARDEVAALAAGLSEIGFTSGDRIWIASDLRPEPLLIALAAHWLGGSAITFDASYAGHEDRVAPAARFAFVQDAVSARKWLEREDAPATSVRFVYLEARGATGAAIDGVAYRALCEHGRALAASPAVFHQEPAILIASASVKRYLPTQLSAAAQQSSARAELAPDDEAMASGLTLDVQLTTVLPWWLHTGVCLSFAEHAATTSDADRRELCPSVLLSSAEDIERLRQRVVESTPAGARGLLQPRAWSPLRWRARTAVRDALGWAHAHTALVAGDLSQPAADFCAALGLSVYTLTAPAGHSEPNDTPLLAALPAPHAVAAATVTTLAPRTREPFLRLDHISLSFNEVKAINDISFGVARHEICALIGPNGAGKSSLLNVINGIYRPNSGQIRFDGQVRAEMTPRTAAKAGIARTFQNLAIFKGMTVLENVIMGRNLSVTSSWIEQALWLGRARASEDASRQRAEEVLEFLRLQRYRHVPAAQLPYGLQKRVELGRAIVADPRLLLLDEPMAGMNADEKADMSEIILDVNRELGTTVVLIEHDLRVVMDLSDHVIVLDYGRLVGDGTPAEVRQNPEVLRAYLGRKRVA